MKLFVIALVVSAGIIAPATFSLDTADACPPRTYYCVLTGNYYATCGSTPVPPIAGCAVDFVRQATLP